MKMFVYKTPTLRTLTHMVLHSQSTRPFALSLIRDFDMCVDGVHFMRFNAESIMISVSRHSDIR